MRRRGSNSAHEELPAHQVCGTLRAFADETASNWTLDPFSSCDPPLQPPDRDYSYLIDDDVWGSLCTC
ncbi:hypothetical protein A9W99_03800 [Mycobacterium sp. 1164966.3]|nr:hypothetical protein A9W99_03800 [Mycobacterium sp. 1164966.3]